MMGHSFTRNVFLTLLTRISIFVLAFVSGVVTARILGPSGKGTLALALLIPNFASLFLNLGIGISNVYLLGKKKYALDEIIGNSLTSVIALTLMSLPLYVLALPMLSAIVAPGVQQSLLLFAGVLIPLELLSAYIDSIFLGLQDIDRYNMLSLFRSAVTLAFIVILVVILRLGVVGALGANIVGSGFLVILALGILSKRTSVRPIWNYKLLKESVLFGLRGQLGNTVQFFNYRLDVFIVNYFLGMSDVGVYEVAVKMAEMLWYIPKTVATVLFPRTAATKEEEARAFTPKVCRSTIFITSVLAVGLFMLSKPLIPFVFSDAYRPSIVPLWLLLPGIVALSVSKVLFSDLSGRGLVQCGTYSSSIVLIVTLVCNLLLIPKFGVTGAALASSIAYGVHMSLALFFYTRVSSNSVVDTLILTKSDLSYLSHRYMAFISALKKLSADWRVLS